MRVQGTKWLFSSGETIGEALLPLIENEGDYFSVDSPFPETGLIRKNLRFSQVIAQVENHLYHLACHRKSPPREQSCVSR